ncbi:MAG: acyltransferase [Oscillospiraceae bacterium]|nr:acyltransferase [Oscillospiraceae bacterium]
MEAKVPLFTLSREDSNLLKGLAVLQLLLTHTGYMGGEGGLVLFMIVSGFGVEQSYRSSGLRLYWNKRIRKVWLPYVPIGLMGILLYNINYPGGIICSLLGLDFNRIADKTMWYISYILAWYAAYYLVTAATGKIGKEPLSTVLKLAGLLVFGFLFRKLYQLGVWHENSGADNYIYAFPFGVLLNSLSRVEVKNSIRNWLWGVILFVCLIYMMKYYPWPFHVPMAMIMGIIQVAMVECVSIRGKAANLIMWFGKYTYPIYLIEGLVLGKRNLWFGALGAQPLIDLGFIAITAGIAVLYWDGIYSKLEKSIPWDRIIRF